VNNTGTPQSVRFDIQGVTPAESQVRFTTLAHDDLMGFNTLSEPEKITPVTTESDLSIHTFPPHSFTVTELSLTKQQ
jgi:hypothetical protein